ncbi:MAG: TIGR03936 family radical SAM-associated protein [Bacillota bacterium]
MLIRCEFKKLKPVRYISHLELMDTFRRAFRRAQIPVSYTQGYNPHIILSLGQPLSVGMTGLAEYFDLELEEKISSDEFLQVVNKNLPPGIVITEARYVPDNVKSLQAVVNTAIYLFAMEFKGSVNPELVLKNFLDRKEIKITRFRRNKEDRELDLAPMIYDAEIDSDNLWRFTVSTGSSGNVRPSEVVRALSNQEENIKEIPITGMTREGMFVKKKEKLLKPFSKKVVGGD